MNEGATVGWEYLAVQSSTNSLQRLEDRLNEYGAEGWELVGFASADKTIGLNSLVAMLRRQRPLLAPLAIGTEEGWYPDPSGRHPDRHWSGRSWTKWVRDRPGGTRGEDPPYADVRPTAQSTEDP